jgi:UDP-sulfoquinovose synthase
VLLGPLEMSKKVIVLGGDGFVGWPTALHLSAKGKLHILITREKRSMDHLLNIYTCE